MLPKMKIQKTVIVFSIILLALVSCKSSYTKIGDKDANYIPYYLKVYEADSLFIVGNYQRSYEILDSLFKKYEPVDVWIVFPYRNYIISKNKVSTIKKDELLEYVKIHDYAFFGDFDEDIPIKELIDKFEINSEEINKEIEFHSKSINASLRQELIEMLIRDQEVRRTKNEDSIKKVDWAHSERLKEIISEFGYPDKRIVGGYYFNGSAGFVDLSIIFNHISYNGDYEYFKKLLPELVKRGECSPFVYAMMEDRRGELFEDGFKYYSYLRPDIKTINAKKINNERKKIGLPSIEYMELKYKLWN